MSEMKIAAFDLGISWEELPGATKSEKGIALIEHCRQRDMLDALVAEIKMLNPSAFG